MRAYLIVFAVLVISLTLAENVTYIMPSEGFMSMSYKLKQRDTGKEALATSYLSWDDKNKQLYISMLACESIHHCAGFSYWLKGDLLCVADGDITNGTDHSDVYHWQYSAGSAHYSNMGQSMYCKPDFKPVNFLGVDGVIGTCYAANYPDDEAKYSFSAKKPSFETLHGIDDEKERSFAIYTGARGTVYTAPDWPAGCKKAQFASRSSIQEKLNKLPSFLKVFSHI